MSIHFHSCTLSQRRIDQVLQANNLNEANKIVSFSDLIHRIIDFFKGGVERATIKSLFDQIQDIKNKNSVTERLTALQSMRELAKPEYQDQFQVIVEKQANNHRIYQCEFKIGGSPITEKIKVLCDDIQELLVDQVRTSAKAINQKTDIDTDDVMLIWNLTEMLCPECCQFTPYKGVVQKAHKEIASAAQDIFLKREFTQEVEVKTNGHTEWKDVRIPLEEWNIDAENYQLNGYYLHKTSSGGLYILIPNDAQSYYLDERIVVGGLFSDGGDVKQAVIDLIKHLSSDTWDAAQKALFHTIRNIVHGMAAAILKVIPITQSSPIIGSVELEETTEALKTLSDKIRHSPVAITHALTLALRKFPESQADYPPIVHFYQNSHYIF